MTDKGLKRDNNEDTFLIVENGRNGCDTKTLGSMYAVADGMGGHCAGETASRTACESLVAYYSNSRSRSEDLSHRLSRMFAKADRDIFELSKEDPGMADMGTTLSVLVIREDNAYICHVGDSRIYRLRDGTVEQLTKDHTKVQELIDIGRLSPREAKTSHLRHIITQAMGTRRGYRFVFTAAEEILPGDRFLLCSDGLHDMVPEEMIQTLLQKGRTPEEACRTLITAALDNGGEDNITVIAVFI